MIASMMMYARPETEEPINRFWQCIRAELSELGVASPEHLSQTEEEYVVWQHPELVLSQTCGMPYRQDLHDKVKLVGTPDYGLEACDPGYYRSAIVVRRNEQRRTSREFHDARFAYNQPNSQSGYAAAYTYFNKLGFWFENTLQTGSHRNSVEAVANGKVDVATIDALTWHYIERFDRHLTSELQVLGWTEQTPGLPLITAAQFDANTILLAVKQAISKLSESDKAMLRIRDIVSIDQSTYLRIQNPP